MVQELGKDYQGQSAAAMVTDSSKRYAGRGTEYLRSLNFGFIRQRFSSGSFWGRKSTLVLFMFPVVASVSIGITQMVRQSFMIYLKYQAMVDAFYNHEKM